MDAGIRSACRGECAEIRRKRKSISSEVLFLFFRQPEDHCQLSAAGLQRKGVRLCFLQKFLPESTDMGDTLTSEEKSRKIICCFTFRILTPIAHKKRRELNPRKPERVLFFLIPHFHEAQAVGRRRKARKASIAHFQNLRDTGHVTFSFSHFDESPDHDADHVL